MIRHGTRPAKLDRRDYSFHRTFGTVSPLQFPPEYSCDAGLTMPDQNADGNPFECTAYTSCDLGTDQDGIVYAPEYTYMKTLYIQGLPSTQQGSDVKFALKSAKIYGLLPKENMPSELVGKGENYTADQGHWPVDVDTIAGKMEHRKGRYFNVYDDGGMDWFDSFRSALWLNKDDKRGISIGTPWFHEWATPQNGVVTSNFIYDGNPMNYAWHNWAIKGWKVIDGKIYLMGKPWQGKNYGDNGWCYFSRETIHKVMEIRGSIAYTLADAELKDIQSIQLGMLETVLVYLYRILGLIRYA